jgi:hypothetical protein
MRRTLIPLLAAFPFLAGCLGCGSVAPPPSRIPSADAALGRMRATLECANAVRAKGAKLTYFGDRGRVHVDVSLDAARPAKLRMDAFAPPPASGPLETLTSDGTRFMLRDVREQKMYVGAATACNIARLTTVPIPGFVLVDLLRGQAPVLKHDPAAATIEWSGKKPGYYVVTIPSTRGASEEIHLTPNPDDWNKPWAEQRMRVIDVLVQQQGFVLYHADLDEHAPAAMAQPILPEIPGDPTIPVSGPTCAAEVPKAIHVEVPNKNEDLQFRYEYVEWNPPLPDGQFTQPPERGFKVVGVQCEDTQP